MKVPVGGVAGFVNSGPARVAATSDETVFVGVSGEGGPSGACSGCLGQMNRTTSQPTYQPAPQPEVSSVTGAPLLQADAQGQNVYLAFGTVPGGPVALWTATVPDAFTVSFAKASSADLTTAADGTFFALTSNNSTELHISDLILTGTSTTAELENFPAVLLFLV